MRILVVVLFACAGSPTDMKACPSALTEGDACSFSGTCWHYDSFSSCASGWCSCVSGKVKCDPLAPENGKACGDSPITECSFEGVPSCETNPTAAACSCDQTGIWSCTCYCYGGLTSCPIDPCTLSPEKLAGARCAVAGEMCAYPSVTCRCESDTPDGNPTYHCSAM